MRTLYINEEKGGEIHFDPIYYKELTQSSFDLIRVWLTGADGAKFPFQIGPGIFLKLHFIKTMSNDFYLTLNSGDSIYHDDNTASSFRFHLPYELNVDTSWKVGLAEVSLPGEYWNITKDETIIKFSHGTTHIPEGRYTNNEQLVNTINKVANKQILSMDTDGHVIANDIDINVHYKVASALGWSPQTDGLVHLRHIPKLNEVYIKSPFKMDVKRLNNIFGFIYLDCIEAQIVGNTYANVLKIMMLDNNVICNHTIASPIHYVPLSKSNIADFTIHIRASNGKLVPFVNGTSQVTLHFKQA